MGSSAAGGLWRHQQWSPSWPPSWIFQELEISQVKTARNGNFFCLTWKITRKYALCMILASRFTFGVKGIWKNMYFHPKMARPPATYDVISRNHSYWPSLNLSQNVRKGWTTSHWKRQVLMFYPLGKKTLKNLRGVASNSPPPPLVRPRVKSPGEGRGGEVEEKIFSSLLTPYEDLSHTVL